MCVCVLGSGRLLGLIWYYLRPEANSYRAVSCHQAPALTFVHFGTKAVDDGGPLLLEGLEQLLLVLLLLFLVFFLPFLFFFPSPFLFFLGLLLLLETLLFRILVAQLKDWTMGLKRRVFNITIYNQCKYLRVEWNMITFMLHSFCCSIHRQQ